MWPFFVISFVFSQNMVLLLLFLPLNYLDFSVFLLPSQLFVLLTVVLLPIVVSFFHIAHTLLVVECVRFPFVSHNHCNSQDILLVSRLLVPIFLYIKHPKRLGHVKQSYRRNLILITLVPTIRYEVCLNLSLAHLQAIVQDWSQWPCECTLVLFHLHFLSYLSASIVVIIHYAYDRSEERI